MSGIAGVGGAGGVSFSMASAGAAGGISSSTPVGASAEATGTAATPSLSSSQPAAGGASARSDYLNKVGEDLVAMALLALLTSRHKKDEGGPSALGMALAGMAVQAFSAVQAMGGPQGVGAFSSGASGGFQASS
jgi:hypothetical protein